MKRSFAVGVIAGIASAWMNLGAYAAPPTGGTGPGGIGTTDGASSLELWMDAGSLTQAEGSAVSSWADRSGNGRTQVPGSDVVKPEYHTNVINGRPVVRFPPASVNGFRRSFAWTTLESTDGGFTVIAAVQATNNPGGSGFQGIMANKDSLTTFGLYIDSSSNYRFWPQGLSYAHVGSGWKILSAHTRTNGAPLQALCEDGAQRVMGTTVLSMPASATYAVFSYYDNYAALVGDGAELIAHGRALNAAERTIIENYLSAKYALPLDTANGALDVYAGDDPAKGNYDYDVFGIGRVSASAISTNGGAAGCGIEATGGTLDADGEWVMAGHNGAVAGDKGPQVADVPAGVSQRWERVWYVDKTGSVDVNMAFDYCDVGLAAPPGGTSFKLLYSPTNAPFIFTALALSASRSGDTITFSVPNATLVDGYYTLGSDEPAPAVPAAITGGAGPGGIGTTDGASSLELWLDAGSLTQAEGSAVSSWADRSGNGRTQVQASSLLQPEYHTNVINGRPVVRFLPDTVNGFRRVFGNMTLNSTDGGFTVIAAVQATNNPGGLGFQGILANTNLATLGLYIDNAPAYRFYPSGLSYAGVGGNWNILSAYTRTNGAPLQAFYEDGVQRQTGSAVATVPASDTYVAFTYRDNYVAMVGDGAELIAHGRALNAAERTIVENYLSAKYALALDTASGALDVYAGDAPAKGNYDFDVFGIGNLGGAKVTSSGAAGFGLAERGVNDVLTPGEFVLAGHNGAAAATVQDGPDSRFYRWGRVWYVDVTGSAECVLAFDVSDAGASVVPDAMYRLFYRAAGTDPWTALASSAMVSGDRISFIVPAAQMVDGYYTLGWRLPSGTAILFK